MVLRTMFVSHVSYTTLVSAIESPATDNRTFYAETNWHCRMTGADSRQLTKQMTVRSAIRFSARRRRATSRPMQLAAEESAYRKRNRDPNLCNRT